MDKKDKIVKENTVIKKILLLMYKSVVLAYLKILL